jgi:sigma-B regulation protein RsbU (phosphoserine phosphatase)
VPPPATESKGKGGPFGANARLLEVALYVNVRTGAYWPLRRDLIIGCSAAVALLGSMTLMGFRFRDYVRAKQIEQQLELARQVQRDLLPSATPPLADLDCAAECVPAWQVGGDFYDVFTTQDSGFAFVLGDVSGKGLPAALLMGLLHGAVRSSSWVSGASEHEDSSKRLNELLFTRTSKERFASLVWCFLNRDTSTLRYVNAGHLPPLLVTANGREPSIQRLEEGGPVLGLIPTAQYHHGSTQCRPGDLLVLYSDGVVEAVNQGDQEFGQERLEALLKRSFRHSPSEVVQEILANVRKFLNGAEPQDDLTLLVVRVPEPRKQK